MHLKKLSYYKTGGECAQLFAPTSSKELQDFLASNKKQYFILGAGTNSLLLDSYWPGVAISLHALNKYSFEDNYLVSQAGVLNSDLCQAASNKHLAGIAWMAGLPGQIGATTRMNARCYGGEISQVITKITTLGSQGKVSHYYPQKEKCFRGYKDTIFMQNQEIITEVKIKLYPDSSENISQKMQHCQNDRKSKGHYLYPSCGCVFKNDYKVGVPAGMLIESCGFKESVIGGAQVSSLHANFIFNKNQATSSDILNLSFKIRERVWEKFGVWLQYEMEVLGELTPEEEKIFHQQQPENYNEKELYLLRKKFKKK
jgi:UDP-N-acetylmuramate dehydrogenase